MDRPLFSDDVRKLSNNELRELLYNLDTTLNAVSIVCRERGFQKTANATTEAFLSICKFTNKDCIE